MKKLIPLFCLYLLSACSGEPTPASIAPAADTLKAAVSDTLQIGTRICRIGNLEDTNYTFPRRQEHDRSDLAQVEKCSQWVRRSGDTLFIRCDNDSLVKLVNDTTIAGDDGFSRYTLEAFEPKLNAFVIFRVGWEFFDYLIVEKATGHLISTISYPIVSPNGRYFIAGNCDLFAAFTVTGLELYTITAAGIKEAGLRELDRWGPEALLWKDDSTVIIKATELKGDNMETVTVYKALHLP